MRRLLLLLALATASVAASPTMRRLLLLLALATASVAASAARAEAPAVPPGAVAVVAGETVTRARLDELLVSARRSYGTRYPARGTPAFRRIQGEAVRFLVDWAEIRQQSGTLGVEVTPSRSRRCVVGRLAHRAARALRAAGRVRARLRTLALASSRRV